MTKLVSLKDKPATEENLHEFIYNINGTKYEMLDIRTDRWAMDIDDGVEMINIKIDDPTYYWNKPALISEQEYNELVSLVKEAVEIVNRLKPTSVNGYYADLCGNFINKAKGVLE